MGIYLGLGSNVGDREGQLRFAVDTLRAKNIAVWRSASLYWTQPRDLEDQPWFLNTVIEVRTLLEPADLLRECLDVERIGGRIRDTSKGPRPVDIDILIYRDRVIEGPGLTIPHPRYRDRRFVLVPMAELAPDLTDPVCGLTMTQLLDLCSDTGEVRRHGDSLL
jgi:2-amino-4-hydroxy-6-hydroxymethyldihydropteridine diphosphokinase